MKTAVLLLIGAAVIGPIEGKYLPMNDAQRDGFNECMRGALSTTASSLQGCESMNARLESLPELCARAMKESGARQWPHDEGTWGRLRPGDWFVGDPMNNRAQPVRCIPVPEGYRR